MRLSPLATCGALVKLIIVSATVKFALLLVLLVRPDVSNSMLVIVVGFAFFVRVRSLLRRRHAASA